MSKNNTVSIRLTVLGVFIIITGLTAAISLGLQYYFSGDLARTAAENTFRSMSEKVGQQMNALDHYSANLVDVLGNVHTLATFPDPEQERCALPLLGAAMKNNPSVYAVYVGYANGDFFELINLESGKDVKKSFQATPQDSWVLVKITSVEGVRSKTSVYLDTTFKIRAKRREDTDYDPRKRPWFSAALASERMIKTRPYFFSLLKAPGVTYAQKVEEGQRVVAADISLAGLSEFLQRQRFIPDTQAFIFDATGEVLARASQTPARSRGTKSAVIKLTDEQNAFITAHPTIRASNEMDWPPFDFAISGSPKGYSVDMLNLLAEKTGLRIEYVNGFSWDQLVAMFQKGDLDLLHSLLKNDDREKMGVFSDPYIPMPQTFAVKKGNPIPRSFDELKNKTLVIPKGWATDTFLAKKYPGLKKLYVATPLDALRSVSAGKAYATLDSEPVLRYLVASHFFDDLSIGGRPKELNGDGDMGLHFLVRPEKKLLATILNRALAAVTPEEKRLLDNKWFGQGDIPAAAHTNIHTVPHQQLLKIASTAGLEGNLRPMTISGREYFGYASRIETAYGSNEFLGLLVPVDPIVWPYMKKVLFSLLFTVGTLLLLIPVVWYFASIIVNPINALALESKKVKERRYEEVGIVKSNITEIFGLSRSMVSMASAIKAYEESLKELMDSFIQLIAVAIDQKSPYTGGHCARVPALSMMLAQAADSSTDKPFSNFSFKTGEAWREFRTAAWLHDCGKVTMPEYIVDKATKLETIHNRIHEVRMRFEVLLRDAETDYWQGMAKGEDAAVLSRTLSARQKEIEENFAFIAGCNVGGEFMDDTQVARVKKIAEETWERRLDDRLGLGHLELLRYPEKTPDLPCREPLLADRPEHIIERPEENTARTAKDWCNMEVPKHLYNLGEIYNLCISRGTLTAEDRYKINEHIITTITMLETLPYPENMKRIPEYAGVHHETLIGTGYPCKLKGDQIGIPGRIIAIADIFEALTASDRPYKKAKTLSESIKILSFMVKDNHLDADLFKLFLESGVYMTYAEKFLVPEQINEVHIEDYIRDLT